jgi:drug/metabolite transporter (DMT)-like permease
MAGIEAWLPDGERLRRGGMIGLLIGFSGIVLLVWPDLATSGGSGSFVAGVIALQVACIGWALGSSYSRRQDRTDNLLGTTAYQMLAGGLMLVLAGTMRGEWSQLYFTPRTTTALLYLATFGSIGGYVAYTYALRHLRVSLVSLYAYINPIIAVALGVLLLGEPFDSRMAAAAALVLAGVAVVRWTSGKQPLEPRTAVPLREPAQKIA